MFNRLLHASLLFSHCSNNLHGHLHVKKEIDKNTNFLQNIVNGLSEMLSSKLYILTNIQILKTYNIFYK